jgi:succinoglycan biosynthesis protein ExoA
MSRACVIIPTLNEARHIARLVRALDAAADERLVEIIVADGGSTDGTSEIVAVLSAEMPRVRLLPNPGRTQAAGVNRAAAAADPLCDVLVRIDAHSRYPPDFIGRLLDELDGRAAESVVVRLRTVGRTCFQRAVAAASNSRFGSGGAAHRTGGPSRYIDHGHHAAFRRAAFNDAGGYDEAFRANEDAEFDARLRARGGRIWFAGDIVVEYEPRSTAAALAVQYFRYGQGRAANVRKHGRGLRPRQAAPPLFLLAMAAALLAAPVAPWTLLAPTAYLALCLAFAAVDAAAGRDPCRLAVGLALPIMHGSWAAGFIVGLIRKRPSAALAPTPRAARA